jgi:hypothetical protein
MSSPWADHTGFAATLELVLDSLPEVLVPPPAHPLLRRLAALLTPVPRGGFECRLGDGAPKMVDLQQGISVADGEPIMAAEHLLGRQSPGWEAVQAFLSSWSLGKLEGVAEVWLELDADGEGRPSVFARVDDRAPALAARAADSVVDALVPASDAQAVHALLDRCTGAVPAQAWVSHVGVMLGRPTAGARLHVRGLRLGAIEGYLERIGWLGDKQALLSHARRLLDVGDDLTVCLDVAGGRLLPRAGLECFFAQKSGVDPRWTILLASLCEDGLCTPAQAQALRAWPGRILPTDVEKWPGDLVVREVGRDVDNLGVVERRLSHVKVTLAPGQPASAKAYFGFGAIFVRVGAPRVRRSAPAPAPAPDVSTALQKGVEFLLGRRSQAGWWRDFIDRARPPAADALNGLASDEWVSAYVACALAGFDHPEARRAAAEAHALLAARRRRGGWGYHARMPHDADSTIWALRLGRRLGAPLTARDREAMDFVRSLTAPDGGVATYRVADTPLLARFRDLPGPYGGWCATHTCVTAAAAALDLGDATRAYLRAAQRTDGSWRGYWWDDDEYTTAVAVDALAGEPAAERGAAWAAERVGDRPAFPTALALQALATAPTARHASAAGRAIIRLLEAQRADGSWPPSARLRMPPPPALDPLADGGLQYIDEEALFTTATVLEALRRSARPAAPSPSGARA